MKRGLSDACNLFFLTLSNPTRLAILEMLRQRDMSVTEITTALGQEQSMISHNLTPLVRCGLVFVEQRWKERIYSLNHETMEPLFQIISDHFDRYCTKKASEINCNTTTKKLANI